MGHAANHNEAPVHETWPRCEKLQVLCVTSFFFLREKHSNMRGQNLYVRRCENMALAVACGYSCFTTGASDRARSEMPDVKRLYPQATLAVAVDPAVQRAARIMGHSTSNYRLRFSFVVYN